MKKNVLSVLTTILIVVGIVANAQDLEKEYSNKYFSLRYPSSWQIIQDDNRATETTVISLQIMQQQLNDYDYRPNINIIVSATKWIEPTSYLARQTADNNKKLLPNYVEINITNDVKIDGNKGSLLSILWEYQGFKMRGDQYIVKKADNTTFIITATTDNAKYQKQSAVIKKILDSIVIK
ncbi:MAG: hypothetical protein II401_02685 [Bacteroidales bacterium]|nr:hypothetical protein [Bacteroidales bacterium]